MKNMSFNLIRVSKKCKFMNFLMTLMNFSFFSIVSNKLMMFKIFLLKALDSAFFKFIPSYGKINFKIIFFFEILKHIQYFIL